jgi:surfactin synthase thioesterase subunit
MNAQIETNSARFEKRKFLSLDRHGAGSVRLILFPFVGGSASAYQSWLAEFPQFIDVFSVELPGHGARFSEAPCSNMNDVVEDLICSLGALDDKPLFFFGHSLGARIAHACCQRMYELKCRLPQKVFISASKSPDTKSNMLLSELNDDDLHAELAKHGGMPEIFMENPRALAYYMPLIRSDMAIFEHYHWECGRPLPIQLGLMAGQRDKFLTIEQLYGWNRFFYVMTSCKMFKGDHFYIYDERSSLIIHMVDQIKKIYHRNELKTETQTLEIQ